MATSQVVVETVRVTKGGLSSETFEDVTLYKDIPVVSPVTSLDDAMARLGNDTAKLFAIITEGIQSEAKESARKATDGWLTFDENEKPTSEVFTGNLLASEVVNPIVLQFAKLMFDFPEGKGSDPDKKRASKQAARDYIKNDAKLMEGLRKKSAEAK